MTGIETGIAIAGVALAAVGTGVAVYSSIQQQQATSDAAKMEQEARNVEAESARQAAAYEETQFRRRAALLLGKNRALAAASGMDPGSGSPLLNELDNIQQAELEALNIRRTGAVGASAREFEGRLAGLRGSYARAQMLPTAIGGTLKAGASVLSGWADYRRASA